MDTTTRGQREATLRFLTHDLRAPISSMMALLELHRFNGSSMTQEDLLGRIEGHAHRLQDMIEAFVELTELELRVPRLGDVNLVDVIAEAIDEVFEEGKKLDIKLYPIGSQWQIAVCRGEREPIIRAIRRLLLNAIGRSPSSAPIALELEQQDVHWVVAISDCGASQPEGSGGDLGLQIVATTAAKYGGRFEIVHNPAGGSTCRFVIPKWRGD
jgi:signal transduction histidine kinase